jgi:hypothetical protein
MSMMQRLSRHSALMRRMAETVQADVGEGLVQGRLTGEELRGAVLGCTTCDAETCEAWLDTHPDPPEPPAFCRNRDLLMRLRV